MASEPDHRTRPNQRLPGRRTGPAPRSLPVSYGATGPPRTAPDPATAGTSLETLRHLGTGPRGLHEAEAEGRLAHWGENALPDRGTPSWPRRLLLALRDPFAAVLLTLAVVSAAVASWGTACTISLLVLVGSGLRAAGEHRADRSTSRLRELLAATATVQRRAAEGAPSAVRELPVDELVPGDVVRLAPGDAVPADLRLLRASGLTVRQSALTGESAPVPKYPVEEPDRDLGPFEGPHLCFQGSSVAAGTGRAVVVATGARTRFASAYRRQRRRGGGAFDRAVSQVAWMLMRFMLLLPPAALLVDALLRGRGLATLPFAVAVAVALTPEMLPVVVSTALSRGAARLAGDGEVLVKRLPALHDLGAAEVLCTDKTGTLTQGRPVLDCSVDGTGTAEPLVAHWAAVNSLWTLQLADAPHPDALDEALLEAAEETVADPASPWAYEGVDALPLDPAHRSACAVVRTPQRAGFHTLVSKGAPEQILERCTGLRLPDGTERPLDEQERSRLLRRAADFGDDGLRVLAVAAAERPARTTRYTRADESGLTLLGYVGLRDAPDPSAAEALAELASLGVSVKLLTGDHPGTAARAARDLGLAAHGPAHPATQEFGPPGVRTPVLTGDATDRLDDAQLADAAERTDVFARCTPEQKARVVTALRARGRTTAYLGDGVNDLPALQSADVGLAPRDAAPVAREAADIVVAVGAAKDLTAVTGAVTVGRRCGANLGAYLRAVLSSNLGNVLAMLVAGLLLPFLPMFPAQVLVQNLCFDAAQLAFAFDRPAPVSLRRPTALRPRELLGFVAGFGLLNAVADLATFAVLALAVHGALGPGGQDEFHAGWFTENLLTQALVILLLRTGRAPYAPGCGAVPRPVLAAVAGLACVGVVLPLSPLAPPLGMTGLPPLYYALLVPVLGLYAAALVVARRRYERRRELAAYSEGFGHPAHGDVAERDAARVAGRAVPSRFAAGEEGTRTGRDVA
ncbi:magnesium-translocating P-type ATPase [Streptomyces xiaopingdaonensis]|uniref:magnesium-translocating P-type ATPase n=1 Tax=Streptomyces xiaopingdaonensis TaxID=1565415 RepID=UPI000377EE10|nr:magnesium-translocating P-type ATPase [Streptomyces xiaopingdaonensis]